MRTRTFTLPIVASLGAALVLAAPASWPRDADAVRGQLLYQNHCQGCHTSRAHVRENRKAHTRGEVAGFVSRWQGVQGLGWSGADIDDVVEWLYLRFYDPQRPAAPSASPGVSG